MKKETNCKTSIIWIMLKFSAHSWGHNTCDWSVWFSTVFTCLQAMKDFISRQKLGRLATADEIGYLVVYLGSDEVRYPITAVGYLVNALVMMQMKCLSDGTAQRWLRAYRCQSVISISFYTTHCFCCFAVCFLMLSLNLLSLFFFFCFFSVCSDLILPLLFSVHSMFICYSLPLWPGRSLSLMEAGACEADGSRPFHTPGSDCTVVWRQEEPRHKSFAEIWLRISVQSNAHS